MRLSTLNQKLADAFVNAADPNALFQQVFWKSYETFGAEMKQELKANVNLAALIKHQIPSSEELTVVSEGFDERYFDLEEEGDLEASGWYFRKARITAAMAQAACASSNLEFAEAAYEALMATDDPQLLSAEIISQTV